MTHADFSALIKWCSMARGKRQFWHRLWYAAKAYDTETQVAIYEFVQQYGWVPQRET